MLTHLAAGVFQNIYDGVLTNVRRCLRLDLNDTPFDVWDTLSYAIEYPCGDSLDKSLIGKGVFLHCTGAAAVPGHGITILHSFIYFVGVGFLICLLGPISSLTNPSAFLRNKKLLVVAAESPGRRSHLVPYVH